MRAVFRLVPAAAVGLLLILAGGCGQARDQGLCPLNQDAQNYRELADASNLVGRALVITMGTVGAETIQLVIQIEDVKAGDVDLIGRELSLQVNATCLNPSSSLLGNRLSQGDLIIAFFDADGSDWTLQDPLLGVVPFDQGIYDSI